MSKVHDLFFYKFGWSILIWEIPPGLYFYLLYLLLILLLTSHSPLILPIIFNCWYKDNLYLLVSLINPPNLICSDLTPLISCYTLRSRSSPLTTTDYLFQCFGSVYLLGILVSVVASAPIGAVEGKWRWGRGSPALVSYASITADSKLEPGIKQS